MIITSSLQYNKVESSAEFDNIKTLIFTIKSRQIDKINITKFPNNIETLIFYCASYNIISIPPLPYGLKKIQFPWNYKGTIDLPDSLEYITLGHYQIVNKFPKSLIRLECCNCFNNSILCPFPNTLKILSFHTTYNMFAWSRDCSFPQLPNGLKIITFKDNITYNFIIHNQYNNLLPESIEYINLNECYITPKSMPKKFPDSLVYIKLSAGFNNCLQLITPNIKTVNICESSNSGIFNLPSTIENIIAPYYCKRLPRLPKGLKTIVLSLETYVNNLNCFPKLIEKITIRGSINRDKSYKPLKMTFPKFPRNLKKLTLKITDNINLISSITLPDSIESLKLPYFDFIPIKNIPIFLRKLRIPAGYDITEFKNLVKLYYYNINYKIINQIQVIKYIPATVYKLRLPRTYKGELPPLPPKLIKLKYYNYYNKNNNNNNQKTIFPESLRYLSIGEKYKGYTISIPYFLKTLYIKNKRHIIITKHNTIKTLIIKNKHMRDINEHKKYFNNIYSIKYKKTEFKLKYLYKLIKNLHPFMYYICINQMSHNNIPYEIFNYIYENFNFSFCIN